MTDRVAEVVAAWEAGSSPRDVGVVTLLCVQAGEQDGVPYVEACVADPESGDPLFRVFHPPLLVPDPEGDVEMHGQRYRRDPLAALAESIAANGGANRGRER